MPELPDYVTSTRTIAVTVETAEGRNKTFKSTNSFVQFIDIRPDGVWIRNENQVNKFFPTHSILEIEMDSDPGELPEHLQIQRKNRK